MENRSVIAEGSGEKLQSQEGLANSSDPNRRHFETGHLLTNLRKRTVSGGLLSGLSQAAQFALTLASTAVLARILTPSDFGLVAMVMVFISILGVFRDAGLSTATVQREGITQAQVSNLFWINFAVSGAMTVCMMVFSPAIAWFYHEPRLVAIAVPLSVTFVLNGLTVQHLALLARQIRFKAITATEVGSVVIGIIVGIVMALWGCGYWSMVGLTVSTAIAKLVLAWALSSWRPQKFNRGSGTRPLIGFGARLMTGNLIYFIARCSDGLLIGRLFGAESAGLFSRASVLLMRPLDQLLTTLNAVAVPALSRLQMQPERYRRTFLQIYETAALTTLLFSGLLPALARPLTLVVLGPQWEKASAIFAAFTIAALFIPVVGIATLLFNSQGRGADSLASSVFVSIIVVAGVATGLPFGPFGVALAYSVFGLLLQMPIVFYLAGRRGPVSSSDLWMGFLRHLPIWVVVCAATYAPSALVSKLTPLEQLLLCAPVGLIAGGAFIWLVAPARRVALSALSVAREFKRKP